MLVIWQGPICVELHGMLPVTITVQWTEDWLSTSVVNRTTVPDPTIWQPGFRCLACTVLLQWYITVWYINLLPLLLQ